MNVLKKLLPLLLMLPVLSLTQCTTEGCTDETSFLYNEKADEDDGTCRYRTRYVFWWKQPTADFLLDAEVNQLYFYIDGEPRGKENTRNFNETAPDCNLNMPYSGEFSMAGDAEGTYYYLVTDADSVEYFRGAIEVSNANDCHTVELDWFE